jgi:DNA (cytosine-5)-methyltransferase 1
MSDNKSPAPKSELSVENHTEVRKQQFTFGSLFAGIGGMDLGLEWAGMTCKWQVEISPFSVAVLQKHWQEVPKYGDITKLDGSELEPVDLICGGFPCQDVSLAGLRKGIGSGTRSGLYADMLRLVSVLRPRFVLMENVSGLLVPSTPDEPAPISRVLGDLAEIGFDAEWDCIPASALGAPHQRDRVFIIAYVPHADDPQHEGPGLRNRILSGELRRVPWWPSYAGIRRRNDGVPAWMDRLKACGNAVVPQVAEWIGKRILSTLNVVESSHVRVRQEEDCAQ